MKSYIQKSGINNLIDRGDKVQDKSGFPDWALMQFGHEIIVIIALILF